jgi:uncharacterized membrane protein
MAAWTLIFHMIGLVFWLGSLLTVTHVLRIHTEEPFPEARSTLERLQTKLIKGLAHPGAALMVITGILLMVQKPQYLHEHWLQAKLTLVVLLIALDLRIYSRTKALHAGRIEIRRGECMAMHGAIALLFYGILLLVFLRPFHAPGRRASIPSGMPGRVLARLLPTDGVPASSQSSLKLPEP